MRNLRIAIFLLIATTFSIGQNITGTVTNGTTGKAAASVDVALVDPMQGMAEVTTTKSGADGSFSLKPSGPAQGPRLVRVTKDGVNYFKMVPPGTNSASMQVYDAAKSVAGIKGTANVIRLQADNSTLHVLELYAVQNDSNPPRTLQTDNTFEFVIPDGATLEGADAQGPGGQPISVTPTEVKPKGHYAFSYALKPGETRFQLSYKMPYSGAATLSPKLLRDFEHFVVVVPSSMKWEPKSGDAFRPMQDQPGTTVQVASAVKANQDISFKVSGTGTIAEPQDAQGGGGDGGGAMGAQQDSRPGGGLGAPIDAPDALEKYRWAILGVLAVVLCGGAYLAVSRGQQPALAGAGSTPAQVTTGATEKLQPAAPSRSGNALLDAMKDEMFQLEIDRQSGTISEDEYKKMRATLEQTLALAISRSKKSTNA